MECLRCQVALLVCQNFQELSFPVAYFPNWMINWVVTTSPESRTLISLKKCNLSDECLPIVIMWSANVEMLNLSKHNFTILPECIKDFQFLSSLTLDDCKFLREIRGIPPNLKWLSAKHCKSLTSSTRNMLLNQVFFSLVFDLIFY